MYICIYQRAAYKYILLPNVLHDFVLLALPALMDAEGGVDRAIPARLFCKSCPWSNFPIRHNADFNHKSSCIASFVHACYMLALSSDTDQTYAVNQLIWSVAEAGSIFPAHAYAIPGRCCPERYACPEAPSGSKAASRASQCSCHDGQLGGPVSTGSCSASRVITICG